VPAEGSLDLDGLGLSAEDVAELLRVDEAGWKAQLPQVREHFAQFERLPDELKAQLEALEQRLS
jgi:phosphoenolpyruvate carboxykinase (GTP)